MRTFIENYLHFMKNCIRPHYEKLNPLKSGFIENSNFENNRDPCPQGPQTKAQLHISIYVWPPNQFLKIDFAHNIINYNWIYPPSGPDRAHRHKLQNIYPCWKCTVYFMSVGPVGPGGGIYSIIEDVVCKVY